MQQTMPWAKVWHANKLRWLVYLLLWALIPLIALQPKAMIYKRVSQELLFICSALWVWLRKIYLTYWLIWTKAKA